MTMAIEDKVSAVDVENFQRDGAVCLRRLFSPAEIEQQRDRYSILGWEVEPGDAICFHMLTLHASAGIEPNRRRRVFSVRFLGDDVTHAPRRWATSPDFPGLTAELPAGAPMEHALFPIVWRE